MAHPWERRGLDRSRYPGPLRGLRQDIPMDEGVWWQGSGPGPPLQAGSAHSDGPNGGARHIFLTTPYRREETDQGAAVEEGDRIPTGRMTPA
jgi:hypothetical protein